MSSSVAHGTDMSSSVAHGTDMSSSVAHGHRDPELVSCVKVGVAVLAPVPNRPTVSVDFKQHFNNRNGGVMAVMGGMVLKEQQQRRSLSGQCPSDKVQSLPI